MESIQNKHNALQQHQIYQRIENQEDVKVFMKWHAFAVWDFMSLLKSLQREITCIDIPWRPSQYPKDLVRFINEIVLGEESDEDGKGSYTDHFSMYTKGMEEVGAQASDVNDFIESFDLSSLPGPVRDFVTFNISLAMECEAHKVASAFFYGRENLIPDIFQPLVDSLKANAIEAPYFKYYLERHIELDGDEHGHLAKKCLDILCDSDRKRDEARETAILSLQLREALWDFIVDEIDASASKGPVNLNV